jgi:hypothetical protein
LSSQEDNRDGLYRGVWDGTPGEFVVIGDFSYTNAPKNPKAIEAWAEEYQKEMDKPATPTSLYGWVGRRYGVWPSRKLLKEALAPREAEPEVSASEVEAWATMRATVSDNLGAFKRLQAEDARPTVKGYTVPPDDGDVENIWAFADTAFSKVEAKSNKKQAQSITLPDEPVALALLSDPHFGNPGTNYKRAKLDAELIAATPGMYVGTLGDITDNWIVGKLTSLQRGQALGFELEKKIARDWLKILMPKLCFFVSGNHDLWTSKVAGIDPYKEMLAGKEVLYDEHEAIFDINHSGCSYLTVGRHSWRGTSPLNPTHGIERAWVDYLYDIAIGGHLHTWSLCRPFVRNNKRRFAIQMGTSKQFDSFAREIGFPATEGVGSAALVFRPNAEPHFFPDLKDAASYLGYLRGKQ